MKIDYEKISEETGIKIKGRYTKGKVVTFLDLSEEDRKVLKIKMEEIWQKQI